MTVKKPDVPIGLGDPSVNQLCTELNCNRTTVYRLKKAGEIQFYRLGRNGDLRAFRNSVDAFKRRGAEFADPVAA